MCTTTSSSIALIATLGMVIGLGIFMACAANIVHVRWQTAQVAFELPSRLCFPVGDRMFIENSASFILYSLDDASAPILRQQLRGNLKGANLAFFAAAIDDDTVTWPCYSVGDMPDEVFFKELDYGYLIGQLWLYAAISAVCFCAICVLCGGLFYCLDKPWKNRTYTSKGKTDIYVDVREPIHPRIDLIEDRRTRYGGINYSSIESD